MPKFKKSDLSKSELLKIVRALRAPTKAQPGSEEKIRILQQRCEHKLSLHVKGDWIER